MILMRSCICWRPVVCLQDASWFPRIRKTNGVEGLLAGMETAIRFATRHSVGFVLDANASANDRWRAVASRLVSVGLTPPADPPTAGYIDFCEEFQTRTGVWMMPNNGRKGALEDFLIDPHPPDGPPCWNTPEVPQIKPGNWVQRFQSVQHGKQNFGHGWLGAKSRGLPTVPRSERAISHHDSPDSEAFLCWFRKLFHAADEDVVSDGS